MKSLTRLFSLSLISFGYLSSAFGQQPALPPSFNLIHQCDVTEVKSQDRTGTCWSFSTSSYLESEILKLIGKEIDISEMFTVRNIYLEKAQKYLRYQGTSQFSQGSLAHDLLNSYEKDGLMPETAYPGKHPDSIHNHSKLVVEMKAYLDSLIGSGRIDADWKIKLSVILDAHLGPVPSKFSYEGKQYDARSFAKTVVPINLVDYVGITSFTHHPFYEEMVVEIPDNFSGGSYFNLPLDRLSEVANLALSNGYSIEWDGDVSEIGFSGRKGYAVFTDDTLTMKNNPLLCVEKTVNQGMRQDQFDNYETTDDHLMHITGIVQIDDGRSFYLVKNSWGTKAGFDGYLLMSEAYFQMKTVSIYVNKNALTPEFRALLEQ